MTFCRHHSGAKRRGYSCLMAISFFGPTLCGGDNEPHYSCPYFMGATCGRLCYTYNDGQTPVGPMIGSWPLGPHRGYNAKKLDRFFGDSRVLATNGCPSTSFRARGYTENRSCRSDRGTGGQGNRGYTRGRRDGHVGTFNAMYHFRACPDTECTPNWAIMTGAANTMRTFDNTERFSWENATAIIGIQATFGQGSAYNKGLRGGTTSYRRGCYTSTRSWRTAVNLPTTSGLRYVGLRGSDGSNSRC